ncbi:SUMF1/EgtB/PvdO family nonheme iron enzyme [Wenzhouxiangella marina]|uniref:Sulphatase-modifying factor protein n=1 Tax=Wenzhouxiangella marina TaxID=1579979 RepID=A0A0K0XUT9_9GAMM|nr:SUMF1/EgtB/PvdO family nonheme iron enzyme [Wenzhouxiangella marina]AKS41448.1 Sulphatase-modifying factor protein [Wenzhouxiangella marina]MBB6086797.1 serine/threonine-protein kinase [Wenzhouxiangella marina]
MVDLRVGRYTILKRLGGGGFGEVFLGEDPQIGRQVAIKVFKPKDENLIAFATSSDEEGLEILRARFLNEAKILASLENATHIVNVLEYGELEDGSPYYVMPYLPHSLADELGKDVFDVKAVQELPADQRPRALPLERSLAILEQLLKGLAAAHGKGLIHRDLKPSNIMLTDEGEVRIVDFGIAKAPDTQHSTVSQLGLGSRNYMAPEQRESAKHVDARADVYAFGRLAYRMLTGRLSVGRFADPNVAVPELGEPMNALLLAALDENREQRPADATVLLDRFRAARAQVGEQANDSDTGTWVGEGEAGVRDELKPLRARIAEVIGEQGIVREKDWPGLRALASIADLDEKELKQLIDEVIRGDQSLAAKHRLVKALHHEVQRKGFELDDEELSSFDAAAQSVGWDRSKVKSLMSYAPGLNAGARAAAAGNGTRASQAAGLPLKALAAVLAAVLVLGAGGYGVMQWREGQKMDAAAEQDWQVAQGSDTIAAYEGFIEAWPEARAVSTARERIAELEAQGQSIVGQVQDYLNRLDYRVPSSGTLDLRTESAIRSFEEAQGLPVAGVADEVLLEALQAEYRERDEAAWSEAEQANTEQSYVAYRESFPQGQYLSQVGERIDAVRQARLAAEAEAELARQERAAAEAARQSLVSAIQRELARLGRSVSVDGELGPGTAAEIRAFERATKRGETGAASESLLAALQAAARWPALQPGERFRDCEACPEMVVIPSGQFMMGSPAGEAQRDDDEGPQRQVRITAFALARTEVSFAQWDACVADGGCSHRPEDAGLGRGDRPVINVSWNDAQEYVSWLSRTTGEAYRLPSEAEWEYAARAGTTTRFHTGRCITTDQANFDGNYPAEACPGGQYRRRTVPVGSFGANGFGLHDMHGNVGEWTEDCWNESYRSAPADGSARMSGECGRAVLRGGSWLSFGRLLRSANRGWGTRANRFNYAGFRPARSVAL